MSEARKFMVVGSPRSGTTWLSELIGSHPDVLCMHEPFHIDHKSRQFEHRKFWDDDDFFLHPFDKDLRGNYGTITWAREYLEKKVWTLQASLVGWKGLFNNFQKLPGLKRYVLELGDELAVIMLERNPVRSYLSMVHARQTQQWQTRSKDCVTGRGPIALDAGGLRKHIGWYRYWKKKVSEVCGRLRVVHYADLLGDHYRTMGGVLDFLGLRHWALQTNLQKLQQGDLRDLVTNLDEIRETLPERLHHFLEQGEIL